MPRIKHKPQTETITKVVAQTPDGEDIHLVKPTEDEDPWDEAMRDFNLIPDKPMDLRTGSELAAARRKQRRAEMRRNKRREDAAHERGLRWKAARAKNLQAEAEQAELGERLFNERRQMLADLDPTGVLDRTLIAAATHIQQATTVPINMQRRREAQRGYSEKHRKKKRIEQRKAAQREMYAHRARLGK